MTVNDEFGRKWSCPVLICLEELRNPMKIFGKGSWLAGQASKP
jgi:hypothetical protein